MTSSRGRYRLLGIGTVALAAILSAIGVPITSAQGTALVPVLIDGSLPTAAPFDPTWDDIRAVDVPLSGQPLVPPMRLEPAFASVRVKSLMNHDQIAFLLEWRDATMDDAVLRVDTFADAAAMQFALGEGTSICMGQQAGGLNIWHWKADWARDMAGRLDVENVHPNMPGDIHLPVEASGDVLGPEGFLAGQAAGNLRSAASRTSSVEDLNAVGFGTLTNQPPAGQEVDGASEYRDGVWRVVLSRDLSVTDPNDVELRGGGAATVVAFAVWDGARGDRDGQKSVSNWLSLVLPSVPPSLADSWPLLAWLGLVVVLAAGVVLVLGRLSAVGTGVPPGSDAGGDS